MQTKKKQIHFSAIAFGLGIAGLVCNLIFISYDGVPVSIACGIMAIACAIVSRGETENGKMPARSRTAVIMAIVALVFGIIIYELMCVAYNALSDPATSKVISAQLQNMLQQLPPEMQGMFQ